uniref:Uncharacterized protein n=1 Tax=Anguilla anguilla TaxID=7936 RepID=A0A0E9QNY5_ANGAN
MPNVWRIGQNILGEVKNVCFAKYSKWWKIEFGRHYGLYEIICST